MTPMSEERLRYINACRFDKSYHVDPNTAEVHVEELLDEIRRLQSELAEQRKEIEVLKKLNEEYLGMIKETEKQEKNNDRRY